MNTLTTFLMDLATNPTQQQAFLSNPEQVMAQANLSAIDQNLLKHGDSQQIMAFLSQQDLNLGHIFADPAPDATQDPDPVPAPIPLPNPDEAS